MSPRCQMCQISVRWFCYFTLFFLLNADPASHSPFAESLRIGLFIFGLMQSSDTQNVTAGTQTLSFTTQEHTNQLFFTFEQDFIPQNLNIPPVFGSRAECNFHLVSMLGVSVHRWTAGVYHHVVSSAIVIVEAISSGPRPTLTQHLVPRAVEQFWEELHYSH